MSAPVVVVGMSCRLPGAPDAASFWRVLQDGACTVGRLDHDRMNVGRFFHPDSGEPGFAYSFAAGLLDNPFAFDPALFGISPREAQQMDPQQRILLELVWEALEDAGIPPSSLGGRAVGVYVGASSLDYGTRQSADPASIEAHFMPGNTLSIVSNRISYIFNFTGPSFTVDTACSSSLVALNQAMLALRTGQVDTAVVAGVNLLDSPVSFIGFSRAQMLSPTGRCRPFSANADGYVRAEGGVVLVLRRMDLAWANGERLRAVLVGSAVNSDGHKSGITLPSHERQRDLLETLYRDCHVDPDTLAFVEAHGTGTRVGDPAEADAIGRALGQPRAVPLPVGSVKSNIGHLEPASGLAGVAKAILALEHRTFPASLHLDALNPDIPFAALNLAPAHEAIALPDDPAALYAGVSSFGFGGTNAHVILRAPTRQETEQNAGRRDRENTEPQLLVLSAQSHDALKALAARYHDRMAAADVTPAVLANAIAAQRDTLDHRLALPVSDVATLSAALSDHAQGRDAKGMVLANTNARAQPVAFVFSGNGAQWAGMGRVALLANAHFRERIEEIDARFRPRANWSIAEALASDDLERRLAMTSVAQPLLFAIQSAASAALARMGLQPDAVLGHSVGEVAAAEACGALTLEDAVELIFLRSRIQELAHGLGTMAAFKLPEDGAIAFLAEGGFDDLEIAAVNAPSNVTLAGPSAAIEAALRFARGRKIAARALGLDYPFHSRLLDPLKGQFLDTLRNVRSTTARTTFISAVTGREAAGETLDTSYWWRNLREPVRFADSVRRACEIGCRVFVEIGPRAVLTNHVREIFAGTELDVAAVPSFDETEIAGSPDPVRKTLARAFVNGARVDHARAFGSPPATRIALPSYPFQRREFRHALSPAAIDALGSRPRHPLIGARLVPGGSEWHTAIDPATVPYLADHKVDGETVMPGAALAEMALAAAREHLGEGPLMVEDFDIVQALVFSDDAMREILVRLAGDTQTIEIFSRRRLADSDWTLHARGRVGRPVRTETVPRPPRRKGLIRSSAQDVYDCTRAMGLDYGPQFRRVLACRRDDRIIEMEIAPSPGGNGLFEIDHVLHPTALDAAFHPLMLTADPAREGERRAYLPVRIGSLRVYRPGAAVTRAYAAIDRHSERALSVTVTLLDEAGEIAAVLADGRFRAAVLSRESAGEVFLRPIALRERRVEDFDIRGAFLRTLPETRQADAEDGLLLLGFARSLAHRSVREVAGTEPFTIDGLIERGAVAEPSIPLLAALLGMLDGAGLAAEGDGGWSIAPESGLPDADAILRTLIATHPDRAAEGAMAARLARDFVDVVRTGIPLRYQATLAEEFAASTLFAGAAYDAIGAVLAAIAEDPDKEPLRIAIPEPGALALLRPLLPLLRERRIAVAVTGSDAPAIAALEARFARIPGLSFVEAATGRNGLAELPAFHLALASGLPCPFGGDRDLARALAEALAPGAPLVLVQPPASPVLDLFYGATKGWFENSAAPDFPVGRILSREEAERVLADAGFGGTEAIPLSSGVPGAELLIAHRKAHSDAAPERIAAVLPGAPGKPQLETALSDALLARGCDVQFARLVLAAVGPNKSNGAGRASAAPHLDAGEWRAALDRATGDSGARVCAVQIVERLDDQNPALSLQRAVQNAAALFEGARQAEAGCRLFLITRGAAPARTAANCSAAATGFWAFARVAMNEYADLDIRLADLAPDLDMAQSALALADLMLRPGLETETLLDAAGRSVMRMLPGLPAAARAAEQPQAARLDFSTSGSSDRLEWRPVERRAPSRGEIEIEVAASGLNFRDVMFAMGLLPEDMLEAGFAGATLGFECAGTVVRAGDGVTALRPGDRVMTFASGGFATHVTVPASIAMPVPRAVSLDAAATIPVAFLTAWYALAELAKIRAGEWVLIHGAAGAVGLAAMQIARLKGARIAATAGSDDKRALARLMGADLVLDSRSLNFADEIARAIGGVDVVLNSLSGAAMEASLKTLKPFGRFIELGKRDFAANSPIGLRPFRQNLSYFGVDADQLLAHDRRLTKKLVRVLSGHFESGALSPLPFRTFESGESAEAFLLMQRAGHVGKIVLHPPRSLPVQAAAPKAFAARADGVHLVTGGNSGFGFESACWLAERGARTIVLASRSGALSPENEQRVQSLRDGGVTILVEQADIADRVAVNALLARIAAYGPLAGVVHAAMVLGDELIRDLSPAKVSAVLAPKISGAANLDAATRTLGLDYFVLFSSITTLIGNPGQASYVAANGFLEGLARRRRAHGLPALAVAWGPISDAGILARDAKTQARLARRTGQAGLKAREALMHLDRLLADDCGDAAIGCARLDWRMASRDLRVLQSPLFSALPQQRDDAVSDAVDLAALIRSKSPADARAAVTALVASQVAGILRIANDSIDVRRPLTDLGMDSLMGLELRMTIEERLGVELPLVALTAGKSLSDIVGHIVAQFEDAPGDAVGEPAFMAKEGHALLARHGGEAAADDGFRSVAEGIDERRKAVTRLAG
jgi:acyl transferase domain-containing protein/NADPH:quinone reductase-like Zn-dependent oxidoreductase/acyl carrier protein/short-subunit dehydrogenase